MPRKLSLLVLVICISAVAQFSFQALAQDQASRPAGARMVPSVPSNLHIRLELNTLLGKEKVQKELGLGEEQKTKVAEAIKASTAATEGSLVPIVRQRLNSSEMQTKMGELVRDSQDKLMKNLDEILSPQQVKRLKEIIIQSQGAMALLHADMIKALDISEDQQKQLKALRDEFQGKMKGIAAVRTQSSTPEAARSVISENQEKLRKAKKIIDEFMLKVLTQDQRDKFEKMQGAKIDIDLSSPAPPADSSQVQTK